MQSPGRIRWVVVALALSFAACNLFYATDDGEEPASGLEGQVLRGPMCPVVRQDQPCPDQPFSATFEVFNSQDRLAGRFESDAEGHFRVALDPGAYMIIPDASAPLINPRGQGHKVTVEAGRFKQVTLSFDTGIR